MRNDFMYFFLNKLIYIQIFLLLYFQVQNVE